jgi:hypothetical protein
VGAAQSCDWHKGGEGLGRAMRRGSASGCGRHGHDASMARCQWEWADEQDPGTAGCGLPWARPEINSTNFLYTNQFFNWPEFESTIRMSSQILKISNKI